MLNLYLKSSPYPLLSIVFFKDKHNRLLIILTGGVLPVPELSVFLPKLAHTGPFSLSA